LPMGPFQYPRSKKPGWRLRATPGGKLKMGTDQKVKRPTNCSCRELLL